MESDGRLLSSILSSSFSIDVDDIHWQEEAVDRDALVRKLNLHIMLRFCLLTILNNMDRANLVRNFTTFSCDCFGALLAACCHISLCLSACCQVHGSESSL